MTTALIAALVMLAMPAYLWLRWSHTGHGIRVVPPEHVGADESWSPLAILASGAADWDEGAQLHARLDELQAQWTVALDAIEASALAILANSTVDASTRELVLLVGVAG